jgi:Fungal Zn(2)-Cys(6) binuclear cluster domain
MACTECRAAKVKCDKCYPCKRCQRLGRDCIPHESKQGQNPLRKKRRHGEKEHHKEWNTCLDGTSERVIESAVVESNILQQDHYGLQSLVRHWIALSITRRSFKLWSRAGSIAAKCGMDMDTILCETNGRRGMDFLHQIIVSPSEDQKVVGNPLTAADIPTCLWNAIGLDVAGNAENPTTAVEKAMENRLVFVRETTKGTTRFYCSSGFERHVVTRELVEETFRDNKKEVKDLFLARRVPEGKILMLRGFAQQVDQHYKPGIMPKPVKLSNICILAKRDPQSSQKQLVDVDMIKCVAIPNLDQVSILIEIVGPKNFAAGPVIRSEDDGNEGFDKCDEDEDDLDRILKDDLLDVDDIGEGEDDFKLIFDLLRDS